MKQTSYRKTSKINIIATWVCAVVLAGLSFKNYGLTSPFYNTAATMFGTAIVITGLYFIPMDEIVKGAIIVTLVGLATMLASLVTGGSDRNFIASFFVLALATLYFDSRIILSYAIVYLGVCTIVTIINPIYIDGTNYEMARVLIKLVIYAAVSVVLFAATRKGQRLLSESERNNKRIAESIAKSREVSENLHQSVETGNQSMEYMAGNISQISISATGMRDDMKNMSGSAQEMSRAVQNGNAMLEENMSCSEALSEQFEQVRHGVHEGKSSMHEAEASIKSTADTVFSANDATKRLLHQMDLIGDMLKNIHSIASKTNLLSVNASIEAARSGVYGKGFAVVAGEIRALAAESGQYANNIQGIVEELIEVTELVSRHVSGSADSLKGVLSQIDQVSGCLDSLERISDQVGSIVGREHELIENFRADYQQIELHLSTVAEQINRSVEAIGHIDNSLQEQGAASEEIAAQLEEITAISSSLISGDQK